MTRSEVVRKALRAAEMRERELVLTLTDGVPLNEDVGAPIDERWLAAERAYLHGEYQKALNLFGAVEADDRSPQLRPWQRFLSLHRRSFAALQLGDFETSQEFIERADALRRSDPSLSSRESDATALRAHLAELIDDFESARTLLNMAHEKAVEHEVWERAATTAADLIRIAGIIGEPAEGLRWVRTTRTILSKKANPRVEKTLRLREGMMYAMLGRDREALGIYAKLIREGEATPTDSGFLVDVLGRRADLRRRVGQYGDAEADLRHALELAEKCTLWRHALYLELDYATLCLEKPDADHSAAFDHFLQAIRLLQDLKPPPRRLLRQMAELVIAQAQLIGRVRLPTPIANELSFALQEIERLGKPSVYQRGSWDHRSTQVYERLRRTLLSILGSPVRLRSGAEVHLDSGRVKGPNGFVQIQPAQVRVLRVLFDHGDMGVTLAKIADELGDSEQAVQKSIERIRKTLGSDLETEGAGRARRRYKLLVAQSEPEQYQ